MSSAFLVGQWEIIKLRALAWVRDDADATGKLQQAIAWADAQNPDALARSWDQAIVSVDRIVQISRLCATLRSAVRIHHREVRRLRSIGEQERVEGERLLAHRARAQRDALREARRGAFLELQAWRELFGAIVPLFHDRLAMVVAGPIPTESGAKPYGHAVMADLLRDVAPAVADLVDWAQVRMPEHKALERAREHCHHEWRRLKLEADGVSFAKPGAVVAEGGGSPGVRKVPRWLDLSAAGQDWMARVIKRVPRGQWFSATEVMKGAGDRAARRALARLVDSGALSRQPNPRAKCAFAWVDRPLGMPADGSE